MRLSSKAIAACALLSFSPLCLADFYAGGSGMLSVYKYDDVKSGFGGSAFGGYRGETVPLVFEVGYLTTGKNKIDGSVSIGPDTVDNMSLSFQGAVASVGYFGRFDRKGSGVYGRVGYYTGKSKLQGDFNGSTVTLKENSNGAMFAIGVDWMLTPYFGFRADIGSLIGVKAIPSTDEKSGVTTANLGVVFSFGGPDADASRFGRRAARTPVYSPAVAAAPQPYAAPAQDAAPVFSPPLPPDPVVAPSPAPVVAPAPAPAPVVAPAPRVVSAPANTAQVVPGAMLRSGPTMKSAGIRSLPDGGSVKLLKRETNAEGPWWSVQLEDGTTGWMIEWSLTRISKH